jgi:TusA-related sulfurtransferase
VAQLRPGDELDVIGDDPVMGLDLEAWCFDTGHELLEQGGEPPDSGPIYWRIVVREHRGSRPEGMDGLQPDDDSEVGNARRDDDKT